MSQSPNLISPRRGHRDGDRSSRSKSHRKPVTAEHAKIALVVLGMHRSGTSAVTRVISLLGADLPGNLMPALADNNETGFWESAEIYRLNEEILESAQSSWDDSRRFDPGWFESAIAQKFRTRAIQLLEKDFARSSLFVLKDPRICRLLPFWLDALDAFGAQPRCVIPVRNPLEVAASLRERDGFSVAKSLLLWLRHTLDTELGTRRVHRVFVSFEELLEDWRTTAARVSSGLRLSWPIPYSAAEGQIDQFLRRPLRHHRATREELLTNPEVSDWVRSAYRALLALSEKADAKRARVRIEKLSAEFERAEQALGGLFYREEQARRAAESELRTQADKNLELTGAVRDWSSHAKNLQGALEERQERIHELQATVKSRDAKISVLETAQSEWMTNAEGLRATIDERQARVAELQTYVTSLEAGIAGRQARVEELETRLHESGGEMARLRARAVDLDARLGESDERAAAFRGRVVELETRLQGADLRTAELETRLQRADSRTAALRSTLEGQQASIRELEHRVVRQRSAADETRAQRNRLALRLNALQTSASWQIASPLYGLERRAPTLVRALVGAPKLGWWALTLRLPARLRLSRKAAGLVDSGLFDLGWYVENNPEIVASGANPVFHWLLRGFEESRDPCDLFDTDWYLKENPEVSAPAEDPLSHYLRIGAAAGRDPNPLFDSDWYLSRYPDVAAAGLNPLAHYLRQGARDGYDPNPLFDSDWYLSENPDVAAGGLNPLAHYLHAGAAEGRDPNPWFDTDWYLGQNPDVAGGGMNALVHYLCWGGAEGRDPSPNFNTELYLSRHPEVAQAGGNPLVHFLEHQAATPLAGPGTPGAGLSPNRSGPSSIPDGPGESGILRNRLAHIRFTARQAYSLYGGASGILRKAWAAYRVGGLSRMLTRVTCFSRAQQTLLDQRPAGGSSSGKEAPRGIELGAATSSSLPRHVSLPNFWPSQRVLDAQRAFRPHVTVIVPSFNHADFLRRRLDSLYNQTYREFSVLLLDDRSTDSSREVLSEYAEKFPSNTRVLFNGKNSGSVFLQWKRGMDEAESDLVWIAESDDYCDPDFLETLIPFFADDSVRLAYARSTFVDEAGEETSFRFEHYLDEVSQGRWTRDYVETAHREVALALGRKNTIPNVSSAVFRKIDLSSLVDRSDWTRMRICGDWILYLNLIRGGKIAYSGSTTNYYRFHTKNTSAATYRTGAYFREHEAVACEIARLYDVPDETLEAHRAYTKRFFQENGGELAASGTAFEALYDTDRIEAARVGRHPNILMACFAFSTGGGEVFPIRLANALIAHGYPVTMFDFRGTVTNPEVRETLSRDIAVIERNHRLPALDKVLRDFGIEVIHTHHASVDQFFAANREHRPSAVAQVVTMHGMYEAMEDDIFSSTLRSMRDNVDGWAYLADKNIAPFLERGLYRGESFYKVPNGMFPPKIYPLDRASFGIPKDAFVLCLASRAMPEKGWRESIAVTTLVRSIAGADVQLLLLGDGPLYDELAREALPDYVHLLGFVKRPVDYFAMADAGILPTVFKGESFPLTIIECLMAGRPMIASDVGEVRNILTASDGTVAGHLIDVREGVIPVEETAGKIAELIRDRSAYETRCAATADLRAKFDMNNVVACYSDVYAKARRHRSRAGDTLDRA